MRCSYCEKTVLGCSPITVPGLGPAHEICYQTNLVNKRIFAGLNIAQLDDLQLNGFQTNSQTVHLTKTKLYQYHSIFDASIQYRPY